MKKKDFNKLQPEIQEYIQYMIKAGLITSSNKDKILDKLTRTKIKQVNNKSYGGTTYLEGNEIIVEICKDQIASEAKDANQDFNEALYENIFHELTHACSILDNDLEGITKSIFSDLSEKNDDFPFIYTHGYVIINEYIAQSIAQKLTAEKFNIKNPSKKKHSTFTYNEKGYSPDGSSISYEYDSSLHFYGEVEEFALKFIESVYGKRDVDRLYKDHFDEKFLDVISNEYGKRPNGLSNLYQIFGHMGNIIVYDYYQQNYIKGHHPSFTVKKFKNSVNAFNKIIDKEIDRQASK